MIAFGIALLVVCVALELISWKQALEGIEYDCRLSVPVTEPDAQVELISIITNRKRRFVPFLRLREDVPQSFTCEVELEAISVTEKRNALKSSAYMMPRQRMTRHTPFTMPNRGRYLFLGAELGGGDFLGLSEKKRRVDVERELVVVPRRTGSQDVATLLGGMLGDMSINRFIHEDPMLTIGFREYSGREPMKLISWTQSARTGQLMVKTLDHTIERTATVMLNLDTFAFGSYGEEIIEKSFSLTRDVCEALEDARIPYTFITNAKMVGPEGSYGEVGDGLGTAHLRPILEGLGRAVYENEDSAWSMIDKAAQNCETGRTHIIITPMANDLERAGLEKLVNRSGERPRVLVTMEVCP